MVKESFIHEDFLLDNPVAKILYHEHASRMPVIDYHNHLPPAEITGDQRYATITRVWLNGDHYKWRAMRTLGIHEDYITGPASDAEKFQKWAETVPYTIRNPLYHWTHLELNRYFSISTLLGPESGREIYEETNRLLHSPEYSARGLLHKMNVELVCTTDDPVDDLRYHRQMAGETGRDLRMIPAFRPDKAILIQSEHFPAYIGKLGAVCGTEIRSFSHLMEALKNRIDFFHENGCRLSDHGLEQVYAEEFTLPDLDRILENRLDGKSLSRHEEIMFISAMLYHLGVMYHQKGWVQQFHLGALRNNNTRMLRQLGPDTGFDSIGDFPQAASLARFLDRLDQEDRLGKTILYNLNPADNEVMATMIGNFNDGSVKGKIQYGSAWWFLDQKDGMEKQLNALSNMGLLSCFIGMLTDSRSFLSFPRHEYFRRLLCQLIGRDVQNGELPHDIKWLGKLVEDISYHNAKEYFRF